MRLFSQHLPDEEKPADFVEALAKGLAVLQVFGPGRSEMTLSEVARHVGISAPAARRSLITLAALGYVGQHNRRFFLRPKVMELSSAFYFSARIDELLLPELQRLVDLFGDASSVAILERSDVIYIAHLSQQRARRASAVIGARYPAHATSLGRVLIAGLDDVDLDTFIEKLKPVALTGKTVTDKAELRNIVLEARTNGYAVAVDELDYGVTAIAVPIRIHDGRTVAAINSSGYTGLLTPQQLVTERLPELRRSASEISATIARFPLATSLLSGR